MFYTVLIALVLLFAGATFLDRWLREHLLLFAAFWLFCAWLTLLAVLLAIFDMLVLRAAAKHERRRLEREYLRRTLPRALVRNIADAGRGRGVSHALRAGTVLAGVAAAGFGGAVESVSAMRSERRADATVGAPR